MRLLSICILVVGIFAGTVGRADPARRAQQLKKFISQEKPAFEKREAERRGVLEELDELNRSQNQVRSRIAEILSHRQELQMALENLAVEVRKHREIESAQQDRFYKLMKLMNKIRKEGPVRFALSGGDLGEVAGRVRVLFRTFRMHSLISDELKERSQRLAESTIKIEEAQQGVHFLLTEMQEQEGLLQGFLARKKEVLSALNKKQSRYRQAENEWRHVSHELNDLFVSLEADRKPGGAAQKKRPALELPLLGGRLLRGFGKQVHPQFGTVTFHKGVEIEAEHQAPVHAVMDGMIEFEGWVRGLGNVIIVHHGGGFYSLHAHLFKSLLNQGSTVKKGDVLGLVGDTGGNDKPSLYFELRDNGQAVDPTRYFSKVALKTLRGA